LKKKLTRFDLQKMKTEGQKAVWVTAYDFVTAQLAEEAGMDMLLVQMLDGALFTKSQLLRCSLKNMIMRLQRGTLIIEV